MCFRGKLSWIFVFFSCSMLSAQPAGNGKSPTLGAWAGSPLGSYVVEQHSYHGVSYHPDGTDFQRQLLIATSADQRESLAVYSATSATGPWTYKFGVGSGKGPFDDPQFTHPLPDETITVGDTSIPCHVIQLDQTKGLQSTAGKQWVDAKTGIVIQYQITQRFAHRASTHPATTQSDESRSSMHTLLIEPFTWKGKSISSFVQRTTGEWNGKLMSASEEILSPEIPAHRIEFHSWPKGDTTQPPQIEIKLIDAGVDPTLLSEYQNQHPTFDQQVADRNAQRVQQSNNLFTQEIQEAQSPDEHKRLDSAINLSRSSIPDQFKPQATAAIAKLIQDPSPEVRRYAAQGAARMKIPNAADELLAALHDDPDGKYDYVMAMGVLGDPKTLDTVLSFAVDSRGIMRSHVADALANFPDDPRTRPALLHLLADADPDVQISAISAIAKGHAADKASLLIPMLSDPHPLTRQYACNALQKIGDPAAFDPICKLLQDPVPDVRFIAAASLPTFKTIDPAICIAKLRPMLDDPSPAVKEAAITGETQFKDAWVVPKLIAFIRDDSTFQMQGLWTTVGDLSLFALARFQTPAAMDALTDAAKNPKLQPKVFVALAAAGGPIVARFFLDRIKTCDSRDPLFNTYCRDLSRTAGPEIRDELIHLRDQSESGRYDMYQSFIDAIDRRTATSRPSHLNAASSTSIIPP